MTKQAGFGMAPRERSGSFMGLSLVTGGAGFIGSHLVEALLAQGERVRVLDNLSTGAMRNIEPWLDRLEFVRGDLADPAVVAEAVAGVGVVYHQAALPSVPRSMANPGETHMACATGTLNLLDASRRAGVKRLVYAASSSAYGNQPTASKRETDLPRPISPYGAAKLAGELYCQAFTAAYGFETVCLRYFNVFGPRQDPNGPYSAVIPRFVTAMLQGRQPVIYGDGLQSRDFTYVGNVVQANLLAAKAAGAVGQTLNIANGRSTTLLELVATLNDVLGTSLTCEHADPRPGDVRESLADITLARKLLGYEPQVGLVEGLRRSIAYYRQVAVAA